jgi:hypothetical protein
MISAKIRVAVNPLDFDIQHLLVRRSLASEVIVQKIVEIIVAHYCIYGINTDVKSDNPVCASTSSIMRLATLRPLKPAQRQRERYHSPCRQHQQMPADVHQSRSFEHHFAEGVVETGER